MADLDWTNKNSRSTVEMKDASFRPQISNRLQNMAEYDIVYCHHALRDRTNPPTQNDGITELGKKDAETTADIMLFGKNNGVDIQCIYASPFKRCLDTAKIINSKLNIPIIEEPRLNEHNKETSVKNETWVEFQIRVREALKDIVYKHKSDDIVICITSGVNIAQFISLAYNLKPSDTTPIIGTPSCSPIIFDIKKENFQED